MSEHDDDELLDALGALARAEQSREEHRDEQGRELADERWDALAADDLSAEDHAALQALAAERPDAAHALAAFTPLGAASRDRFADAALAAFSRASIPDGIAEAFAAKSAERPEASAAKPAPDNVVAFPTHRTRPSRWMAGALVLTAAAAGLVFALRPSPDPLPDPLPVYAAQISGGVAVVRGESPDGVPTLGPGERLTIVLVPATPVQGAIAGRAFVIDGDRIELWPAPMAISPEGALRIEGTGEALGLTRFGTGPRTLRIVAGRPDALPEALPDAGDRDGTKQGWQAFDFAVVLTE